ncbi:MAG: CapA family protein [Candidatus Wildermuthbacteria bacterium]|nr:CapA family protein [Candidatus Wildermuthbacteria bacterium]
MNQFFRLRRIRLGRTNRPIKIFFCIALTVLLFIVVSFLPFRELARVAIINDIPFMEDSPQETTLIFLGDVMLDRGVELQMKRHNDWAWPFLPAADDLQKADFVFANLESVISDKGEKVGSIYSFRANPRAMEGLARAGIDVVSVANNHSFDYGGEAFADSISRLKKAGILYAGGGFTNAEAHSLAMKEINGTKIGVLGYTAVGSALWQATEQTPGIAWIDGTNLQRLKNDIANAKRETDILAVSLHAGDEYTDSPNEFQKLFAKTAIESGADLVIGHHPHTVQPVEQYNNGWVAYSLGNFIFDQSFSESTMRGLALKVIIENKKLKEVIPLPTLLTPDFQAKIIFD